MDLNGPGVDVSSFLLLEASGDSELDCNPVIVSVDREEDDDDDAQSCCCGSSDSSCVSDLKYHDCDADDHAEDDDQMDENYYRFGSEDGRFPLDQKSFASVDSADESMNEAEKSKLFWEACLAS